MARQSSSSPCGLALHWRDLRFQLCVWGLRTQTKSIRHLLCASHAVLRVAIHLPKDTILQCDPVPNCDHAADESNYDQSYNYADHNVDCGRLLFLC